VSEDTALDPAVAERIERLLRETPPAHTEPSAFFAARFDAGLAWVHYPADCGGMGLSAVQHRLADRALADAGAPANFPLNPIGLGMTGPTVAHHGTAEQRRRYLRPLYACEEVWCQLFSEPGAGSDLAGLATSAVRDGDCWIVNGQKVWTSLGHKASQGLLLARTDPDAPKNRGITAFIVDMHAPGVDVRPLRQMTGDAEFNEVYLDDLRLPADAQLGPVNAGWQVATTTLMNERVAIGAAMTNMASPAATAARLYGERPRPDPVLRDRVAQMWIESEVGLMVTLRAAQLSISGDPGPVGSVGKLFAAEHALRVHELIVDLLGAEGMLYPSYGPAAPPRADHRVAFLRSRANTIEGGTSEVMRNILGERVLGLPRDDHGPRNRPWREIPRG
jgi:alkylation response protein AidB-like acyl-CoA dehydrogenase